MPKKMIDYELPYYITVDDVKVAECKKLEDTTRQFDIEFKKAEPKQSVCMFRKKYHHDEEDKLIQYRIKNGD